jgi:hypothetical protein
MTVPVGVLASECDVDLLGSLCATHGDDEGEDENMGRCRCH